MLGFNLIHVSKRGPKWSGYSTGYSTQCYWFDGGIHTNQKIELEIDIDIEKGYGEVD